MDTRWANGSSTLDDLREEYASGRLIVFAGAGVSAAAGLPNWKALVQRLIERGRADNASAVLLDEAEALLAKTSYIDALSAMELALGEATFCELIERSLDDKHADESAVANEIAALAPTLHAVLTTNLDRLLEKAFNGRWPSHAQATVSLASEEHYILNLHGTLRDRSTWVLTRRQYDDAMYADPRLHAVFSALFHTRPLLFVGYGLSDYDFDTVLARVRALSGKRPPRHFALVDASEITPYRKASLERSGVRMIGYRNADGKHAEVCTILRELQRSGAKNVRPARRAPGTGGLFDQLEEIGITRAPSSRVAEPRATLLMLQGFDVVPCAVERAALVAGAPEPGAHPEFLLAQHPHEPFVLVVPSRFPLDAVDLGPFARAVRRKGGVVRVYGEGAKPACLSDQVEFVGSSMGSELEAILRERLRPHAARYQAAWTGERQSRFVAGRARLLDGAELPVNEAIDAVDQPGLGHTLLLGDFGTGKSTQLAFRAAMLAQAYLEQGYPQPAPLLLPLSGLHPDLETVLQRHAPDLPLRAVSLAATLGVVRLMFDGLDELQFDAPSVEQAFVSLTSSLTAGRCLVTSRKVAFAGPDRIAAFASHSPSVSILELRELDASEVREFVEKATPSPAEAASTLRSIESTHDLRNLAQRPALLSLIVQNRRRLDSTEVHATDLYALATEDWLGTRQQQEKHVRFAQRMAFARQLARKLLEQGAETCSFNEVARSVLDIAGEHRFESFDLALQEVRSAVFLAFDEAAADAGLTRLKFAHRSFLEYFAAVDIAERLRQRRPDALDLPRLTPEVVDFLSGCAGWQEMRSQLRTILTQRYRARVSENALLALYHAARTRHGEGPELGAALDAELPERAQLDGAQLEHLRLPWLRLPNAELARASLALADLSMADLRGARFDGARASHVVLDGALLDDASFRDADLYGASLVDASLVRADFQEAELEGASLHGDDLPDALARRVVESPPLEARQQQVGCTTAAFTPDGRCLVAASGYAISVLDVMTGRMLGEKCHTAATIGSVLFSPDGLSLATITHDAMVHLWHWPSGAHQFSLEVGSESGGVHNFAFSHDSRFFAASKIEPESIQVWDCASGAPANSGSVRVGGTVHVAALVFSENGHLLAVCLDFATERAFVWDCQDATRTELGKPLPSSVWVSPDAAWLLVAHYDAPMERWDRSSGELVCSFGSVARVRSAVISRDGGTVASISEDGDVQLWSSSTGAPLGAFRTGMSASFLIGFSADGVYLATSAEHQLTHLWQCSTGSLFNSYASSSHVYAVAFSPLAPVLASASYDHTVRLWHYPSGSLERVFIGHSDYPTALSFSPDGQWLASGGEDGTARVWECATGAAVRSLEIVRERADSFRRGVTSVKFSPDGRWLACSVRYGSVQLWDWSAGALDRTLEPKHAGAYDVAFSPDGRSLAAATQNVVMLWDVSSGALLRSLQARTDYLESVAFSPDGRFVASGCRHDTAQLWEVSSGALVCTFDGHVDYAHSVAFSPDGQRVATAGHDGLVRLFESTSGTLIRLLEGHTGQVFTVAFSNDGRLLASGSYDASIRLWDPETGRTLLVLHADKSGAAAVVPGTPFFTRTGEASGLLSVVSGRCAMPAELWAPVFERRDIIESAVAGVLPDMAALGLDTFAKSSLALSHARRRHGLVRQRGAGRGVQNVPRR